MPGWKIVKRRQLIFIFSRAFHGARIFCFKATQAAVKCTVGCLASVSHPEVMPCLFDLRLNGFRNLIQYMGGFVYPAALSGCPVLPRASLMETLYRLGIMRSYSRLRVSNDNACAGSIFRTCKYRPDYPHKGFATRDDARTWNLPEEVWLNPERESSDLKAAAQKNMSTMLTNSAVSIFQ